MRGRERGEGSAPSRGHRQQLTKPSISWIVRMSSPMRDCVSFIPPISSRRSWETAMACERGAAGVSLRGGSLGTGAVTLLWSAQSRGVARGTAGSTIHHIFSSQEGAAAPQRPAPLPWAGTIAQPG